MYKIIHNTAPDYLISLIPNREHAFNTRNRYVSLFSCRTDTFKNSFIPSTIDFWYKLDEEIRNSKSIVIFKNKLLPFIRPTARSVFHIFDPQGLVLLTRLRLGLSHLNAHKFKHNFNDCINPLCTCSLETEDNTHFFLHCQHYTSFRIDLVSKVTSVYPSFVTLNDINKVNLLLYGDSSLDNKNNTFLLSATITYIKETERFLFSLFS